MATETTLDSIIPYIWQIREKTELVTATNYALLVRDYGLTNTKIGDLVHIPIVPELSINSWVPYSSIQHKKPLVVIMVDK